MDVASEVIELFTTRSHARATELAAKLERLNRERVVNVYGDLLPGYSLGQIEGPLNRQLQAPGFLPAGVVLESQGNSKIMSQAFFDMGIALIASFALVYVLMVILYGSFVEPFIVMFSVPQDRDVEIRALRAGAFRVSGGSA